MCTYYYLHYHHLAPCTREIEYALHYSFCPNSTAEISSSSPLSASNSAHDEQWAQQPCEALTYAPEYSSMEGLDYSNPCAAGDCLISQQCSSGGCRLEDLGGSWICCQCNRGGNTLRLCVRPLRKIPDALCYHVVCENCCADHT
ncbi:hypothetical protein F4781DRAFT_158257 [Annulohypoxylon bovei var. microspora]|nr:hypothetical protein F4781DRAFT_158257 [Annulohypoxylon bovei var. microspora]